MSPIAAFISIFLTYLLVSTCDGLKEWKRPEDGRTRLVTGNDGVQTIVFESPTQGTWEIGNGEIWHLPIGGTAKNVAAEFEPIPKEYIEKKKVELKGGSIRNQGDASASIRPFAGNKPSGGGGSIRNPASGSGSIRTKASSGSIRGGSGKKWTAPSDGRARLVKGEDGVSTIVFESPTQGTWEIGNGEIWHLPIGGTAKNVSAEFDPLSPADIADKKSKLSGGSIRVTEAGSIRKISSNNGSIKGSGSASSTGSIRDVSGSSSSGSIRPTKAIHPMATIVENAPTVDIGEKSYYVLNIDKEKGSKNLYSIKDNPVGDNTIRKVKNLSIWDDKKNKGST